MPTEGASAWRSRSAPARPLPRPRTGALARPPGSLPLRVRLRSRRIGHALSALGGREHQRCANKPAQGNALGTSEKSDSALKGRHTFVAPFQGWAGPKS